MLETYTGHVKFQHTADRRMEKASTVEALSLQEGLNSSVMYVGTGWVWFVNAP